MRISILQQRRTMLSSKSSDGRSNINRLRWKVTYIAFYSRCSVLILQIVFNVLIPDHMSDGFIMPAINSSRSLDEDVIWQTFSGLTRWDAQHFLHISVFGYVYEHSLAFFPAFPTTIKLVGMISKPMLPFLNIFQRHIIAFVSFNLVCFVLAARTLFDLSYKELKDEKLSYLAAVFFSINPASIFFSAAYSETLFSFLSFSAMLNDKLILSCVLVTVSACTRSNGILNIGYPVYRLLMRYINSRRNDSTLSSFLLKVLLVSLMSMSLFILFQIYCYREFCGTFNSHFDEDVLRLASENKYILKGTGSKGMCNSVIPYFYIQNHYWNVGLLHYFSWKQVPNFIIALPILSYCTFKTYEYLYPKRRALFTHGLRAVSKFKSDSRIFPYAIHLSVLLIVCFLFVHIQVSTRLLCSSSPLVYWYFAKSLNVKVRNEIKYSIGDTVTLLLSSSKIVHYCLAYYFVGIMLFSNFLPWT